MKIKDIRDMDDAKLQGELTALQTQIFTLRTQAVTQKVEDTASVGKLKKDIARIKTVLRQRSLATAK
jgi:large subunit ribosomal protein L29